MEVGLRVVRGPDWKYGEQDGGEGHVGTVVELGEDSTSVPDDCVVVLWDSGIRKTYRAGHEGCFDLLVLDNGPCGTKHPGINCDGCKVEVISGIRWKCSDCINFDFCTKCYMSDKHDVRHSFYRIYSPSHEREEVGRRRDSSQKKVAMGIFTNATVCRGCDWKWGNQDGGDGSEGTVVSIGDWEGTYRSLARVKWSSKTTSNCRVGYKGSVDLRCVAPASGGSYYKDHLPVLGKTEQEEDLDLASALALGLLQQTVIRPLQKMIVMHELLSAMQEMTSESANTQDVGTRDVRGPDSKRQNQDGGAGRVGTVVEVGGPALNQMPEKRVKVVRDHGETYSRRRSDLQERPSQTEKIATRPRELVKRDSVESANTKDVGTRDIRGPDSKRQNQDRGTGRVGTVVEVGGPALNQMPEKSVKVVRDHGQRSSDLQERPSQTEKIATRPRGQVKRDSVVHQTDSASQTSRRGRRCPCCP